MGPTRPILVRGLACLVCALAALPVVAQTQQQAEQPGALQEVIVTATKRSQNLQEVPFSVSATSQEQIRNSGAMDIVDLARNIAGLAIADLGPGQSQMAIRGISSGQVIRDQPGVKEQVGVYLDESPISVALFTPDLELFDLDRFEVLRGPQGTLFGAGSEAGTVRYITTQPRLGKTEIFTDASIEDVTHGDEGGFLRAAMNVPLGDNVAVRLVAYEHHLAGFIDAISPFGPAGGDKPAGFTINRAINSGDRSGARLSFLIKPSNELSITPRIVFQKLETNGYPRVDLYNILANPYTTTQPAVTIGDRQQYRQQGDGLTDDFTLADLKVDYDTGPATLTSVTSFTHRNVQVLRDATQLTGSVTFDVFGDASVPPDFAGVRTSSPLYDRSHLNVFSEEVRLASNGKQQIDWLVGGFFQHVGRHYGQDLPTPGYDALNAQFAFPLGPNPVGLYDTPFYSNLFYTLKQYAAFGEATWHATDRLSVTAGLRYYKYSEDRVLNFNGVFASDTPPGGIPGSVDSNGTSPRLIFSYKPVDDTELYAQASRGFRLGGINDPINLPLCSAQDKIIFGGYGTWKDEKLWDYEVGIKSQWLDHRLTLNVAAFYENIDNLQATATAGTCSSRLVINVPKSRSEGVEAELFARPNANWDFGISATVLDAKLTSSVISSLGVVGGLQDGNRLPTAPKTQAAGSIGYTVPMTGAADFFANFTIQYVGSSFSQFENEEPGWGQIGGAGDPNAARLITYGGVPGGTVINFNTQLPSYTLANLRFGFRTDRWQAALYVTNVADKTAELALDYERGRSARVGYLTNQPRTVGLYGSYSF
ncbi:MAG TPA: TonB-dependent receptor [Steroidobacteraceae bacterium]|jgi:iron complex outermembrane receptor protein|nr:TonB-dependent receptor [Steroidobacteraceae bacterium]